VSTGSSTWTTKALAVFQKDLRTELRTRYSLNALFMFAFTTLVAISFSLGQRQLDVAILAALYWIIIFFSAMSSLAGVFIKEEDTRTAQTLRLFATPSMVYTGKLVYNMLLLLFLCALITPLYVVLMNVTVPDAVLLSAVILLGAIGLAGATTIIGAIVAKANVRGALFAVLSFPVLLPLLVAAIGGTSAALNNEGWAGTASHLKLLTGYAVIMITASVVLFDYVWNG
jgi:heme exporter protein B